MTAPVLELDALHKRFPIGSGGRRRAWLHAVDGVDLRVDAGESVGLVGESGCGKSTLVRIIARLLDPSGGAVRFRGRDLTAIPAARFAGTPERARVQVVFQDSEDSLNPRFSAADCIAEPLRRLGGLAGRGRRAELRERVDELARLVGLPEELLGRFPHQLSGGQKARVNIARAIALHPDLLVLDEPTSALDVSVQAVILKLLAELKARLGMTYLFVSHDLNVVRLLCERVVVMYLGKVVESGPVDAIFDAPRHPYTAALLAAIPGRPRAGRGEREGERAQEPTSPVDPDPRTCRYVPRCPRASPVCTASAPELSGAAGHLAACHLAPELRLGPKAT